MSEVECGDTLPMAESFPQIPELGDDDETSTDVVENLEASE